MLAAEAQESDLLGTPEFMSPEQSAGRIHELDTRTDVYSLGATLFLLLTGHCPHESCGSKLELMRRIAEQDPRRPRTLSAQIDADLEAILLKAIAHDPEQRYVSAADLARDIDRYLNDEPVEACAPARAYRLRKFVRRNKDPVAAGAAVLLALVLGMSLATTFYIRAERQRREAQTQATIAEAVNQFLSDMLGGADPRKSLGDKLTVLQATETAIKELDAGRLRDQPLVEAAVRTTIGDSLTALGRFDVAEPNLRRSLELSRCGGDAGNQQLAASLQGLAYVLPTRGQTGQAEPLAREALDIRRGSLTPGHPHITKSLILLRSFCMLKARPPRPSRCSARRSPLNAQPCPLDIPN